LAALLDRCVARLYVKFALAQQCVDLAFQDERMAGRTGAAQAPSRVSNPQVAQSGPSRKRILDPVPTTKQLSIALGSA
jgi:hypothetical protein